MISCVGHEISKCSRFLVIAENVAKVSSKRLFPIRLRRSPKKARRCVNDIPAISVSYDLCLTALGGVGTAVNGG